MNRSVILSRVIFNVRNTECISRDVIDARLAQLQQRLPSPESYDSQLAVEIKSTCGKVLKRIQAYSWDHPKRVPPFPVVHVSSEGFLKKITIFKSEARTTTILSGGIDKHGNAIVSCHVADPLMTCMDEYYIIAELSQHDGAIITVKTENKERIVGTQNRKKDTDPAVVVCFSAPKINYSVVFGDGSVVQIDEEKKQTYFSPTMIEKS